MLCKIPFLALLLLLCSCDLIMEPMPESWRWGFKPRPMTGIRNFPPADTDYGKGFRDGCSSALDATSRGLTGDLKPRYDFKRMQMTSDYQTGWWDGFEQCTYIMDWKVV